jgi:uncharacterized delta-60 repeat protein
MMRQRSRPRTILSVERLEDRCVPTAGFLDPTFNTTGVVTTQVSQSPSVHGSAVAIYAPGTANAGKIVAVGEGADSNGIGTFGLVRYNSNGSLDPTFGTGGIVNQLMPSSDSGAGATAVAPVGDKILVSGTATRKEGTIDNFGLARFNADGSLDQPFGTNGSVQTSFGKYQAYAHAMAVQADGKIVVSGIVGVTGPKSFFSLEFAVARYTPNGVLDTSFGNSGIKIIDVGASLEPEGAFAGTQSLVLSGDRIDLIGASSLNDYVVQLTATGQLDPTVGAGGVVNLGKGDSPCLTVQPDGKLVAASINYDSSPAGIHVTRLLANGSPDTGFATGGTATIPWLPSLIRSTAVKVDPLGRFVIGGWQGVTNAPDTFMVMRLTPAGALDSTFGVGGIGTSGSLVTIGGFGNLPSVAMTLQPDGKAVLVDTTSDHKFAVARFDGDAALQIGSFTASPNPVTAGSSVTLTASNLTDTNPGATITQVAFYYIDNSGNQHLLGYAAQTSPGVWTLSFSPSTFSLTSGSYTLFAQTEDSYGVFSDPFALTLTVQ